MICWFDTGIFAEPSLSAQETPLSITSLKSARLIVLLSLGFTSTSLWAKKTVTPGIVTSARAAQKAPSNAPNTLEIAYLKQLPPDIQPAQLFFDPAITDPGLKGARLGVLDNNTTGQFTHQRFNLRESIIPPEGQVVETFKTLAREGYRYVILDLPADLIAQLAQLPEANNLLLLDISSRDDSLRGARCRANVLHFQPSHAMRADALAQYLMKKRWKHWFIATGNAPEDKLFAEAIRKSAKKFGAKVVLDKSWSHQFDDRRTPESEVPVFTQADDYDVVVVTDETKSFGDILSYRTWLPRPIVGTSGLTTVSWDKTHEAWGALQLQNRFREMAGHWMTELDYGAWLAIRTLGEAATRTKSLDFDKVRSFILGPDFALAGFKGVPLSFRTWDYQLRQPVLLSSERSLVAVAPIDGYLHPKNELDTLGNDLAESSCKF
jgi:ABC transporter substrate binding protein (PQQ-dependent alcohol dehydrogenase system)